MIINKMASSVDLDERLVTLRSESSGSTLFALVSSLICRDERIKLQKHISEHVSLIAYMNIQQAHADCKSSFDN